MKKTRKELVKECIEHNHYNGLVPYADVISERAGINRTYIYSALCELVEDGFLERGPNRTYMISKKYSSKQSVSKMKDIINSAFNMCRTA